MKNLVKLINVNDGLSETIKNDNCLKIDAAERTEKIIAAFLNAGYTLHSCTPQYLPVEKGEGGFPFLPVGYTLLFVKQVKYEEVDRGDEILQAVLDEMEGETMEKDPDLELEGELQDENFWLDGDEELIDEVMDVLEEEEIIGILEEEVSDQN